MSRPIGNIDREKFNNLDDQKKAILIKEYCKFVRYIDVGVYRVQLYAFGNEFVEIWFNPKARVIEAIRMPSYQQLDKHIIDVNLYI